MHGDIVQIPGFRTEDPGGILGTLDLYRAESGGMGILYRLFVHYHPS